MSRDSGALSLAQRRSRILLLYVVIALPWVVFGAMQTMQSNTNSPLDWVGNDFAPRRHFDEFRTAFGSGDVVVMSWPGCSLNDPKIDVFCQAIRDARGFRDESGDWYLERVISGREVLAGLTEPPLELPKDEAIRRLQGSIIGPDGDTTCVVASFTEAGLARRAKLVELLQDGATKFCQVPRENQHLAGPVIDGLSVDRASKHALDTLAIPSMVVVLLVAWWALRSLVGALVVCGLSLFCQGLALSLVYFSGDDMNALLIVLPPLIQTLTVAGGIHLTNYFLLALPGRSPIAAAAEAIRTGWAPCLLSGGTTAVGLASLCSSSVAPIYSFGLYAACAAIASTALLLAVLPGILAVVPRRWWQTIEVTRGPGRHAWHLLEIFVRRCHAPVVLVCLVVMVGLLAGLPYLRTSVRIETLFPAGSNILQDYVWLERHIGPMVPLEVLVTCDASCPLTPHERELLVGRLHAELARQNGVGATVSAATFAPTARTTGAFEGPGRKTDPSRSLRPIDNREAFKQIGYLQRLPQVERWRITAFVSALDDVDYGSFLEQVEVRLGSLLRDSAGQPLIGVTTQSTGIMPLVHRIQGQLLSDLLWSFLSAFGLIALIMIVNEAGIVAGLISMLPNVFPMLVLFGILGWTQMSLDVGSVMTASVALGIAVDDTLHFLSYFRGQLVVGATRPQAVLQTYMHCGRAIVQSSLICGMGIGLFYFSDFLPTSRFAWLMAAQLAAALFGDLVLLPALLLGPAGKWFETGPDSDAPSLAESVLPSNKRMLRVDARPVAPGSTVVAERSSHVPT